MSAAELERMMKLQDVILKALAKKTSWLEAAEIAGVTDRTIRRMRDRYKEFGYDGLFDQRRGKRSTHRIPMETAEEVLRLYREVYFDLNVRHFHEKLREEHEIKPGRVCHLPKKRTHGTKGSVDLMTSTLYPLAKGSPSMVLSPKIQEDQFATLRPFMHRSSMARPHQ
jgi:transposase